MWLFDVIYRFVSEATTPDLQQAWFPDGPLAVAKRIGGMLLLLLVILAVAETVWNRDGGQLLRSIGQDAPKVMLLDVGVDVHDDDGSRRRRRLLDAVDGPVRRQHRVVQRRRCRAVTAELGFGAGVS